MKKAKNISFTFILSIVLLFVIAFCISGTVVCQSKNASRVEAKYYRELEQVYVSEVRTFFEERGYEHCGITMTKVIEESGERAYTVTVHHKKLDRLSFAEKEKILSECAEIEFPVKECSFSHIFLEEDL